MSIIGALNKVNPRLALRYSFLRSFSSSVLSLRKSEQDVNAIPIYTTKAKKGLSGMLRKLEENLPKKSFDSQLSTETNLSSSRVFRFERSDIIPNKEEDYGKALLFTGPKGAMVHYATKALAPRKYQDPVELLEEKKYVNPNQLSILEIRHQLPFTVVDSSSKSIIIPSPGTKVSEILPHEQNIERYSLKRISEIGEDDAKRINIKIMQAIYEDPHKQNFYEEKTSVVQYPEITHNQNSATLMSFESQTRGIGTTAMHFHPGEKMLIIYTTDKDAGVELNFCGTDESPVDRPDCERKIQFPQNSMLVLSFPENTHHRFWGDFVCISVHPKEGPNIVDSIKTGNLTEGFLEYATVFSKGNEVKKSQEEKLSTDILQATQDNLEKTTRNPKALSLKDQNRNLSI